MCTYAFLCIQSPEALSNPNGMNWEPQPSWCAHRYGDDYGFGMLHVYNNSAIQWQYLRSGDGMCVFFVCCFFVLFFFFFWTYAHAQTR